MSDPHVREVGSVVDIDGRLLRIGVDYDAVSIAGYRIAVADVDELDHLLDDACKQARAQADDDA